MRGLRDDISIEGEPDGLRMIYSDGQVEKQLKIALDLQQETVTSLFMLASLEPLSITEQNLAEVFDQLEKDGLAGVVYVKIGDKEILKRGFGMANQALNIPNTINTIFATGSRPIDYTVAAIYLLDQQDKLDINHPLTKYLDNVPADKHSMTIQHLLSGQSGLPDFFDTSEDWDPDLAWIDRNTAIERLLSQALLFTPGTDRRHSHAAFGLLAALVEVVSGQTYYQFIRDHFFIPAGMTRTGEYGEQKGLSIKDFAEGGGPQLIGLPNIPPNWGPTSWLIKGSGGMYSNLDDLLKFYQYVRSDQVFDDEHKHIFNREAVNLDGSDRGFELFSIFRPGKSEVFLFLNQTGSRDKLRQVFRGLERLAEN